MSDSGRRGGVPHRGVSQGDVARHAGVSAQTVSRVVNGSSHVDPLTASRVMASVRELNYRPNRAARALRSASYHTIAAVMFSLESYGNSRTWQALVSAAERAEYSVIPVIVGGVTPAAVTSAFERLSGKQVDGAVLLLEQEFIEAGRIALPQDLPIVVIDSAPDLDRPVVDVDQAMGARQAVEHLVALGHTRIAHIAGPEHSYAAARRAQAWRDAIREHGLEPGAVVAGDWSAASGHAAGRELIDRGGHTAVFAANDQMALGMLRAAHERGVDVPGELSVVGFDNVPDAGFYWPPLTTVEQDFAEVGTRALHTLLDAMAGDDSEPDRVMVPTRLRVRESTAAPAASTSAKGDR